MIEDSIADPADTTRIVSLQTAEGLAGSAVSEAFDAGWESGVRDVVQWLRQSRPRILDVAQDIEQIFLNGDR